MWREWGKRGTLICCAGSKNTLLVSSEGDKRDICLLGRFSMWPHGTKSQQASIIYRLLVGRPEGKRPL
jgi:hypothetical protein